MLRMVLAIAFILYGAKQSLKGPFHALLFYLAIAYFRPETWVWSDSLQSLNLSFVIGVYVVVATALSQRERLARTLPVFLIAGLCLHGFISTQLSQHYEWCYFWWKGFAKVSLITILIISLVNTQERFRQVLIVISFSLGLESVKQGWMHLVVDGVWWARYCCPTSRQAARPFVPDGLCRRPVPTSATRQDLAIA